MLLREYIFAIILTTVFAVFILLKLRKCMQAKRINKLAKSIYNEVKTNLADNPNGLSESDILRKYLAYPK